MTRFRYEDSRATSSYYMEDFNPNGSQSSSTLVSSDRKSRGDYRSISDTVTPDYKTKVARGEVIMSPVSLRKEVRACPVETLTFGNHPVWGTRKFVGTMACEWSLPPPAEMSYLRTDMENAANYVLVKAYEKMNSSDFNGLVTLAEATKSASMLTSPLQSARDLAEITSRRFRKLQGLRDLGKLLLSDAQILAKVWLEVRYGWIPIMHDINNITKAFDEVRRSLRPARVVERAGWEGSCYREPSYTRSISGLTSLKTDHTFSHRASAHAGVVFDVVDAAAAFSTERTFGINFANALSAGWELVPYSFVVDWFVDVGSWLNAVNPRPGIMIKGNWVTTKYIEVNTCRIVDALIHINNSPVTDYHCSGGEYSEVLWSTDRKVNQALSFVPPVVPGALSFTHTVDSLALLLGKMRLI